MTTDAKTKHLKAAAMAQFDAELAEKDRRKHVATRNAHMLQAQEEGATYEELKPAVGLSKVGVHKALTAAREAKAAAKK